MALVPYLRLPGASGDYAHCPDSAALSITGDLDVRVQVEMHDWTPPALTILAAKRTSSSATQQEWNLSHASGSAKTLTLEWTNAAGTNASATATTGHGRTEGTWWFRATLDVNDGAGNRVTSFYYSPDGSTWTQIGTSVTTAGTTDIRATVATKLEVGSYNSGAVGMLNGKVHKLVVMNGIGGTEVANPDFTAQTVGATSFNDAAGNTWTVAGNAAIEAKPFMVGIPAAAQVKSAGTTATDSAFGWDVPVGDVLIAGTAADNLSATTPTVTSIVDSQTNTWTPLQDGAVNASAAAGVAGSLWVCKVTNPLTTADTLTATWSGSITAKVVVVYQFRNADTPASASNIATGASATPSVTLTSTAADRLVIGAIAVEDTNVGTFTADTDTSNGTWLLDQAGWGTTGSTANTNVRIGAQYKVTTGSGDQTYNPGTTNTDWVALAGSFPFAPSLTTHMAVGTVSAAASGTAVGVRTTRPTGTVSATATVTSAATRTTWTAGTVTATATVTGTAARKVLASATVAAVAAVTGAADRKVAAAGAVTATATGQATAARTATVAGTVSAAAQATAVGVRTTQAVGTVTATTTATATARQTFLAVATVAGTSTATGAATREALAAGTVNATALATGAGARTAKVAGTVTATSSGLATAVASTASGTVTATATVTASATVTRHATATASAASTGTATATRTVYPDGTVLAVSQATAAAVRVVFAAGPVAATALVVAVGRLYAFAVGTVTATSTATAVAVPNFNPDPTPFRATAREAAAFTARDPNQPTAREHAVFAGTQP